MSDIAALASQGFIVTIHPDGKMEVRAPADTRSSAAKRQAAFRQRKALQTVTNRNETPQAVTCNAPSPSLSFPPSPPSPSPLSPTPPISPAPAPAPSHPLPPAPSAAPSRAGNFPILEEVKAYAPTVMASPECAENFWNSMEGGGWVNKFGHPIADWKPIFRNFATAWKNNDAQRKQKDLLNPSAKKPKYTSCL